MFPDLRTERLLIRSVRPGDVETMLERRNDPRVAQFQNWLLPFPRETAEAHIATSLTSDQPVDGRWWIATVVLTETDQIVGEVVVNPTNGARTAEVGYTFAAEHWGHGYACEALEAFVAWLFGALPLTRVWGGLHPDNRASAMVLERVGMRFEGHNALSFWLGDENTDDWVYGMTRSDWDAWRARPRTAPDRLELVEIDERSAHTVRALRTHHTQRAFVDSVVDSFADALYPEVIDGAPLRPWLRAVRADGAFVGFVMLAEPSPAHPDPYLWRLLIDRMHQRRGIGERVLELVSTQCRLWGASELRTSWREGKGSPRPFYLRNGFVATGAVIDGETEGVLALR